MTTHLLDANVLIALTTAEHVHHERASAWASTVTSFAICPVVEGALVRFLVRVGEGAQAAQHVLRAVRTRPGFDFWPDALSYADVDLDAVVGHRQVMDAYLVDLVKQRPPARLATLDGPLAQSSPELTLLLPS